MQLITESPTSKEKILIVDKSTTSFTLQLKQALKKYDNEVFISPKIPKTIQMFHSIFLINETAIHLHLMAHKKQRLIFVFFDGKKANQFLSALPKETSHVKVINLEPGTKIEDEELEKIFWFAFTSSGERIIYIRGKKQEVPISPPKIYRPPIWYRKLKKFAKPKLLPLYILLIILLFHILFIPFLFIGMLSSYQAVKQLEKKNLDTSLEKVTFSQNMVNFSKQLYGVIRPTYLLFSVAPVIDNAYQIEDSANSLMQQAVPAYNNVQDLTNLLLKTNKTNAELALISQKKDQLSQDLSDINQSIAFINQKLPDWDGLKPLKKKINESMEYMALAKKTLPYFDTLLAKNSEKKYLLMFANNMELRPGGGFIGSFGVLTVKNYTVEGIKVYDVYDADGQLKEHVEPPPAIKTYLNQPHWFLRDSAFSPDFSENYNQAKTFLAKEMQFTNFNGGILLTTSTIQNILEATGTLYLPDFKDSVNKDDFYLKTQYYTETNFFPGSIQKKQFLSAVATQMMIQLEDTSPIKILEMIKKSLDEKQMVMYFDDENLQKTIDELYWSGKTLNPTCTVNTDNCIVDYLFPVDANLGVNKANFFIKRSASLKTTIEPNGRIHNIYTLTLHNESLHDIFPGGTYKNYLQILLPKHIAIKNITKNNTLVEKYDLNDNYHLTVGFYVEVPPQSTAEVVVNYYLPDQLQSGNGVYQLVLQKQIGSSNSDFHFDLVLPPTVHIINKNFSSLVKNNEILYNTSITSDKIFFIELVKE